MKQKHQKMFRMIFQNIKKNNQNIYTWELRKKEQEQAWTRASVETKTQRTHHFRLNKHVKNGLVSVFFSSLSSVLSVYSKCKRYFSIECSCDFDLFSNWWCFCGKIDSSLYFENVWFVCWYMHHHGLFFSHYDSSILYVIASSISSSADWLYRFHWIQLNSIIQLNFLVWVLSLHWNDRQRNRKKNT